MSQIILSICLVLTLAFAVHAKAAQQGEIISLNNGSFVFPDQQDGLPVSADAPRFSDQSDTTRVIIIREASEKNLGLAFLFSMLLAGGGQYYNDEGKKRVPVCFWGTWEGLGL